MISKRMTPPRLANGIGLFHFLSVQGGRTSPGGGIESKISRGFLMKIKKFPGGYKKKSKISRA